MKDRDILCPRDFYDRMAHFYDDHIEQTRFNLLSPEEEKEFHERLLVGRKVILDLGCGTGRTMKLLANRDRRIVGIDISHRMTTIAKAAGLNVIQASCFDLPFAEQSFDAIYSIHMGFGFCQTRNAMNMLTLELHRVLRKDGMVLLDTPHAKAKGKHYLTSWMAGNERINAMSYGKTEEELTKVLMECGFVDLKFFGFYKVDSPLEVDSRRIIVAAQKV